MIEPPPLYYDVKACMDKGCSILETSRALGITIGRVSQLCKQYHIKRIDPVVQEHAAEPTDAIDDEWARLEEARRKKLALKRAMFNFRKPP